ncbi:MAG TPA: peptidoglycan DD-metalloendopeptidase family protein [Pseudobdellovibrionaceae bacterium]|nr:peptidoglycan DD-metalloendopeptidase family protein [Pseudobdellovibrionaceae bacterium]
MKRKKRISIGLGFLAAAFAFGAGLSFYAEREILPFLVTAAPEDSVPVSQAEPVLSLEEAFPHVIAPRSTLFSTLRQLEIPAPTIHRIVEAAKPVQNLSRLNSGIRFQTVYAGETTPELVGIHFRFSAIESLEIKKVDDAWVAKKITEQVDLKTVTFSGLVTSSLWESARRANMDPNLISELADIFGWQVDFSREVRKDDRWRLTVEQKLVKGEPIGWGAILAAEYENAGTPYQAALFRLNGEEIGYFDTEGKSLRRMFLKSPIRYGRITSGFNLRRFHPILKVPRPHIGVDYGAPIGTPVRAVGDGVVTLASWSGGGGNVIKVRHNSTYETAYKHLSGYAKNVKKGARVQQGQVIGFVGNTGLSTGPHLHFEFYQSGRFVDPLGRKFPSADPVPPMHLGQFKESATSLLASLPPWRSEDLGAREMASDSSTGPESVSQ